MTLRAGADDIIFQGIPNNPRLYERLDQAFEAATGSALRRPAVAAEVRE